MIRQRVRSAALSMTETGEIVGTIEDCDAHGRGLRFEFRKLQDRYAHQILAVGCEELPVLLAESIEGTADENWPPSPALQALNLHDLADVNEPGNATAKATMMLGMSGKSHWSLCITPRGLVRGMINQPSTDALIAVAGADFEIAGRLKDTGPLGSSYQLGARVRAKLIGDNGLDLHFGSGRCLFEPKASDEFATVAWQYAERDRIATLVVSRTKTAPMPSTARWSYAVTLIDC